MTIYIEKYVEVEVDAAEIIRDASRDEIKDLLAAAVEKGLLPRGVAAGHGDAAYTESCIERAYLACKRLPEIPRKLAEMFWRVHGRALA